MAASCLQRGRERPAFRVARAGSNPRRDTSQMGTVMTCGNVEGILAIEQELPLTCHGGRA